HRFDPGTLDTVRTMIDRRLQQKWQERFGMLTPRQREQLTWQKLNFGQSEGIDPFVTSELLWEVGWEMLAGRRADLLACCVTQGVGLFVFPLNLLIDPPAGSRSAPLSLLGDGRTRVSWAVAAAVGCAYAALALTALCRLLFAACGRRGPARLFAFWPLLVLFLPVLPFEDPRFRLTLVPMLWLLAVGRSNNPSHGSIP
ncbi:MAG TPA: hypothetical protein VLM89_09295, partial [Phycisphaerae bacterium]|nr:hypothetical protein [Phycisphaerae bacterium]